MKVLITGGAGYIGSTTASALESGGHTPVILDDLSRGRREFIGDRVFYRADVADRRTLETIVSDHPDLAATIHCAARVIVPESVADPLAYYRDNVTKSLTLIETLLSLDRPRIVFSSSASVYATSPTFEVWEDSPLAPASPYGRTKQVVEMALEDAAAATDLRAIILRYFNPIGSDPQFRSGIYDRVPSHVLGRIVAATRGDIDAFAITGTNHPTRDGTGIRDYLHVWDIARAHVLAVERFDEVLERDASRCSVVNLGTGHGVTVLELLRSFERVSGSPVPRRDAPPRDGDAAGAYANVERARRLLGWTAESSLDEALASALEWGRRRTEILPDLRR